MRSARSWPGAASTWCGTFAGLGRGAAGRGASGSLLVARSAGHKKLLAAELGQSRRWGVDLAEISPAEAAERTGGYYHAAGDEDVVWCPEDVYIEEPGRAGRTPTWPPPSGSASRCWRTSRSPR